MKFEYSPPVPVLKFLEGLSADEPFIFESKKYLPSEMIAHLREDSDSARRFSNGILNLLTVEQAFQYVQWRLDPNKENPSLKNDFVGRGMLEVYLIRNGYALDKGGIMEITQKGRDLVA